MKKEFDGFEHPNHTMVPNDFFDRLLPIVKDESELRVILVAIRRTLGYQGNTAELSINFLIEATGMSRNAVRRGIAASILRGTMTLEKKQTRRDGAIYGIRWSKSKRVHDEYSEGSPRTQKEGSPRTPINKVKKSTKESSASTNDALPTSPKSTSHKPTLQQAMVGVLAEITHLPVQVNAGKLSKNAANLAKIEGVTPDKLREWYCGDTCWWSQNDWRGQRGQPPNIAAINETVTMARDGIKPNGNGHSNHQESNFDIIKKVVLKGVIDGNRSDDPESDGNIIDSVPHKALFD